MFLSKLFDQHLLLVFKVLCKNILITVITLLFMFIAELNACNKLKPVFNMKTFYYFLFTK